MNNTKKTCYPYNMLQDNNVVEEVSNSFDYHSPEHFSEVTNSLVSLYAEKNKRYGGSFAKQAREFGMTVSVIRLSDKMERLKYLCKHLEDNGGDESMRDTLMDLASYAIMSIMVLDEKEEGGTIDKEKKSVSLGERLASD